MVWLLQPAQLGYRHKTYRPTHLDSQSACHIVWRDDEIRATEPIFQRIEKNDLGREAAVADAGRVGFRAILGRTVSENCCHHLPRGFLRRMDIKCPRKGYFGVLIPRIISRCKQRVYQLLVKTGERQSQRRTTSQRNSQRTWCSPVETSLLFGLYGQSSGPSLDVKVQERISWVDDCPPVPAVKPT